MAAPETTLKVGRRTVRISNPDKVLFPADGITKLDLANYYAAVAPAMVEHTRDRPLNLWRWNRGIDHEVVIQQAIPKGAPEWVKRVTVARRRGGEVEHAVGGEAATLVWLANQNCSTPHVWTARADKPDQPDRIVFDFDPPDDDDHAHLDAIRAGALAIGDLLREKGLQPYAMTSGSRGIHVVAPLRRGPDSNTVRTVAGEWAEEVAARLPDQLTTSWRKEGRGGRVLVDAARNTYAQTAVAPYAVRAKRTAPVATPLSWDEVADAEPRRWTLRDVPARLRERGDPWEGIGKAAAALRA
ncbi:MAG TPA: non-homologous end-joining DNA ligase [Solirubrobacteraceae bacterium]|nr:non-homologous end-joining DNA ligase [Solirubrobacteraceae bacterium]